MSTAELRPEVIGVVKPAAVHLEISVNEAALLQALMGRCNGRLLDEVFVALVAIPEVDRPGKALLPIVCRALDNGIVDFCKVKDQIDEVLNGPA